MPQPISHEPAPSPAPRRGFTLTELLVVIAIIAILVALTAVGVMTAMTKAKQTRIKVELDQIDSALKAYKDKYGAYPPCNLAILGPSGDTTEQHRRQAVVRQHLALAFPRYDTSNLTYLQNDLQQAGIDLYNVRPDQALVFWLQGFSSNPLRPILSVNSKQINPMSGTEFGTPIQRTNAFFEFDKTRLLAKASVLPATGYIAPSYFPSGVKTTSTQAVSTTGPYALWESGAPPIVYWDAGFYGVAPTMMNEAIPNTFNTTSLTVFSNAGVTCPYWHDRNGNASTNQMADFNSQESWCNPDSFQLIACGGDGKYGLVNPLTANARLYPTGTNYDASTSISDDDNVTNFTNASRIGDDRP